MKTEEFKQILGDVKSIDGINPEKAVDVALTLVQESGKDKRTEIMKEAKLNNNSNGFSRNYSNGNVPATEKQKFALRKNGVSFSDNITKSEASVLLDKIMPKSGSSGKGGASAPSSPSEEKEPEMHDEEWCPHCGREAHDESDCPAFSTH